VVSRCYKWIACAVDAQQFLLLCSSFLLFGIRVVSVSVTITASLL
jgi:hypothetical protein